MAAPSEPKLREDLKILQDAIKADNRDVVKFIEDEYRSFLPQDDRLQSKKSELVSIDTFSSYLLPRDVPTDLIPRKVTGNGDCFFNSASVLIVGDQHLSGVLRLLTAAELYLHAPFYANHPRFSEVQMTFTEATRFLMCLSIDVEDGRDRLNCLKKQALNTCTLRNWAGLIHFMALSSVLRQRIFAVYPEVSPGIRPLFHGNICPRENLCVSDETLFIMFTRDSDFDSRKGVTFQPNHFSPLTYIHHDFMLRQAEFPPLLARSSSTSTSTSTTPPSLPSNVLSSSKDGKERKAKRSSPDDSSHISSETKKVKRQPQSSSAFPSSHSCTQENKNRASSPILQKYPKKHPLSQSPTHITEEPTRDESISPDVKYPFPLLSPQLYQKIGLAVQNTMMTEQTPNEEREPSRDESISPDVKYPFPLLSPQLYQKIGLAVQNTMMTEQTPNEERKPSRDESISPDVKYPFPLLSPQLYQKIGLAVQNTMMTEQTPKEEREPSRDESISPDVGSAIKNKECPLTSDRPYPFLTKAWYERRGMLRVKNLDREKKSLNKKDEFLFNKKASSTLGLCSGTLMQNIEELENKMASVLDVTKKADLHACIKVAEHILKKGPIIATQEAGDVFRTEKYKYLVPKTDMDKEKEDKNREMSASIFMKLSKHLNIQQIYLFKRAYILENQEHRTIKDVIDRLSSITNNDDNVKQKIQASIGDIFKDSIKYMDTKKDKDIVKALFAISTSTSFVAKLQGVSNKTAIMNARDEIRETLHSYKNISTSSQVVRNNMTNAQQLRLTKRILEKRKFKEMKLAKEYDSRGRKLKWEEFPELSTILENIFDKDDIDTRGGGGLESHPRLITSTRFRSVDNKTFMYQARDILLSCAPPNFSISLSSCYNYTDNYRENSLEAKRHHAGKDINARISLKHPPRIAVVDNKQVVNLHWSTSNVNYHVDTAASNPESYMVDSKDAKRIVMGDISPVQKPGKTWKKIILPDHDWDQSRNNAVTPMTHLFLQSKITKKESVPFPLSLKDTYLCPSQMSSTLFHVTRTGQAVTLINLSLYEPETTSHVFNELFLLLSKPSLDQYFRNPLTGKLKSNFVFVVDNGPSETPSSPLVQMWLSRLLTFLNLDMISQVSFAEYHSKRNFVERVHASENEVLSRHVFSSHQIHSSAEPGSSEHKENMEKMATDVKECIQQAKFNERHIEAFRGVGGDHVFNDDDKLKTFLGLSEERKIECDWQYEPVQNDLLKGLSDVWGVNMNFHGSYNEDYKLLYNSAEKKRTAWVDKYQTTLWREDDNWTGSAQSRHALQPIPDYVRWLEKGEMHYLTLERNCRISERKGMWNEMPGMFLPSRVLDIFYKLDSSPPDSIFREIGMLCWLPEEEICRYFKESREQENQSYEKDKARDQWKTTELYKNNSLRELQDKCKKANLPFKGLKFQLVERLCKASMDNDDLPCVFQCHYSGNFEDIPSSVKDFKEWSTAQMKFVLNYHGLSTVGNKDELIIRLMLLKSSRFYLAFYKEESEILKVIDAAEQLILEEREDYLSHPEDLYRVRTHGSGNHITPTICVQPLLEVKTLHTDMFKNLREYIIILRSQRKEKTKVKNLIHFKGSEPAVLSRHSEDDSEEVFFSVGAKVKVKWDSASLRGSGWKPGWYTAYVQSFDLFMDQIVVEHPTEPGCLYNLDVKPLLSEGCLKLVK